MYAATVVSKQQTVQITALGCMEQPIDISWADGMVGALPVFDDYDDALAYVNGDEHLIIEVTKRAAT
jgi:hypothetical protein